MIAVAAMDNNAEILMVIGHLREIGYAWRGGDEMRHSFSDSLLTTVDMITRLNDALYSITSYREMETQRYADLLSYNKVKKLQRTKEHIYTLFRLTRTDDISIEWCNFPPIRDHWMDRW